MSHDFWTGVQLIQGKRADRNMARFMVTMQNKVTFLIQPSVQCSSVMPNDVLLQTAAVMEKVPATEVGSNSFSRLAISKSQLCKP
jgi:hypothetical protein